MPTPTFKPITSWSFSKYSDYKKCPAFFKYKHIMKMKEPPSPHMERGTTVHKEAEDFVKGKINKLPQSLAAFVEEFAQLREIYKVMGGQMTLEDNWGFTKSWDETAWNDWNNCWLRMKLDLALPMPDGSVVDVADYKTGKFNQYKQTDYTEQLELQALTTMLKYPHIKAVRSWNWYLDHGITFPEAHEPMMFTQSEKPRMMKIWVQRTARMFADTQYLPQPSRECTWCPYSKAKNGPCKY